MTLRRDKQVESIRSTLLDRFRRNAKHGDLLSHRGLVLFDFDSPRFRFFHRQHLPSSRSSKAFESECMDWMGSNLDYWDLWDCSSFERGCLGRRWMVRLSIPLALQNLIS